MSGHTPGPWRECGHDRGGCTCRQVWSTSADTPVAVALDAKRHGDDYGSLVTEEGALANAQLIASAPELLEALELLAGLASGGLVTGSYEATLDAIEFAARNAIAKATRVEP